MTKFAIGARPVGARHRGWFIDRSAYEAVGHRRAKQQARVLNRNDCLKVGGTPPSSAIVPSVSPRQDIARAITH